METLIRHREGGHHALALGARSLRRVLVVEPAPRTRLLAEMLDTVTGFAVNIVTSLDEALDRIMSADWDLMMVESNIARHGARSLICQAHTVMPGLSIAAVGRDDDGSLAKDLGVTHLDPDKSEIELVVAASRLADDAHQRQRQSLEVVLAIGAHPDDVEIGVGGTLLAHRTAGHSINVLTMSCGAQGGDATAREREARAAAKVLGARLFIEDLEDTHISAGHPTVGLIERVIELVRPTTIYTHSVHDTHQDHRSVHHASLIAARSIPKVSCYQSPSATIDFRPSRFVPIDTYLDTKQHAIRAFESQTAKCRYLRPDVISATSRYWARFTHAEHVEALEVFRDATSFATNHLGVPFTQINNEESFHEAV